jgi:hypothetical protein
MTILEALDDPELFAPHFPGASWGAWRAFLAAIFALPMDEAARACVRAATGRAAPAAPVREAWVIVGRRGGKSRIAALVAVFLSVLRTYRLAPGEVGVVQVLAADRAQALVVLRYSHALLQALSPPFQPLIARRTREAIELTNGIVIEVTSCTVRSPRGRTVVAAILDEAAYWWSDESNANPDSEVVAAIRPSMATVPGALLLAISSPYARKGLLYDMHRRYYSVDDPRVLVWQADTATMNPTIDCAIIAEAYERDPAAARAEYGAEFRTDVEAFLSIEQVRACVMAGTEALAPVVAWRRPQYVCFVDPAGGSGADSMTAAVAHLDGAKVVVDRVWRYAPPFSPAAVAAELASELRAYQIGSVSGDRFAAQWCAERFQAHGLTYLPSPLTKSQIYLAFAPMVLSEEVALPDHPRLIAELTALERRPSRVGRDAVDHAPRGHDDLANACAGAAVLARGDGQSRLLVLRPAMGL